MCVWQKRKASELKEKKAGPRPSSISWPAWVVCDNTYDIWQAGCELPHELQLSAEAAAQVMRIKYYAAEQMRLLAENDEDVDHEEEEEGEEEEEAAVAPTPLLPRPAPAPAGPMSAWATPALLARMEALGAGELVPRASPVVP